MNDMPILLIDDEPRLLKASKLLLTSKGFNNVTVISNSCEVMGHLTAHKASVVVLDLFMPKLSGHDLLPKLVSEYPEMPVIVMTSMDETETAVTCMKKGAFDFLVKPVESERFAATISKALEHRAIRSELSTLRDQFFAEKIMNPGAFDSIITVSSKMHTLFRYMEALAPSRQPVLILGETGVGKELFAKALHRLSRCKGDFVAVNVSGLDDTVFADTLFGHRKGAFTGAEQAREGLIVKASSGTLFLDEIGDLKEQSQIKLLRLLQEREFYAVGSDKPCYSDARILLATNQDLPKLVTEGRFRKDLYFRLCTHRLLIPPLRERMEDMAVLLDHFLVDAAGEFNKKKPTLPPELVNLLANYSFPGNVRELKAMIYDAVARHYEGILSMESFREVISGGCSNNTIDCSRLAGNDALLALFGHFPTIAEVEEYMISDALKQSKGNQGIAANLLGISRQTLNKRLRIY